MTDDEKKLLQEAIELLHTGTCNSLIPVVYERWRARRDETVRRLREAVK